MKVNDIQDDQVGRALKGIVMALNRAAITEDEKEPLREGFSRLWPELQAYRGHRRYIDHVSEYITTEYEKRNPDEGESQRRETPLCGCASPSCALKRGELPAQARVRQGGLLQTQTPEQAVANEIQRHTNPYVLREADRDWRRVTSEPVAELMDLHGEASRLMEKYDN